MLRLLCAIYRITALVSLLTSAALIQHDNLSRIYQWHDSWAIHWGEYMYGMLTPYTTLKGLSPLSTACSRKVGISIQSSSWLWVLDPVGPYPYPYYRWICILEMTSRSSVGPFGWAPSRTSSTFLYSMIERMSCNNSNRQDKKCKWEWIPLDNGCSMKLT